ISMRVNKRVTHTCLSGHVDYSVKGVIFEQSLNRGTIVEIEFEKFESRFTIKYRQPVVFQPGIVIIVHIVQADNRQPFSDQCQSNMKTYEPGSTGNENGFVQVHQAGFPLWFITIYASAMSWLQLSYGQQNAKITPFALFAFDLNLASVGFNYHFALEKPNSQTGLLCSLERFEEVFFQKLPRHAAAVIYHRDHVVTGFMQRFHSDFTPIATCCLTRI